jgi:hypothetical protein
MVAAILIAGIAMVALAQHRPYAGQQERDLKALSANDVQDYLRGAGMGYAKPAELNHYPGPAHILELADQLGLSPEQRAEAKNLMDAHRVHAALTGAKVIEAERHLEALFRRGDVSEAELADAARIAASLQGEYRLSHLETHRRVRAVLTDEQVTRYDELRGYRSSPETAHPSPQMMSGL